MANLRANKITSTEVFETTGSVQFNDGYLSFDKNILLDLNNYSDWTIECWIYRTANATNDRGLIIGFDAAGNINSNILAVHNDGYLYMGSDSGSNATPRIQTSNNTISFNTWYHISVVKKSTSIKLFVNGIESASGIRSTWTFTDLSVPGLIGSRASNDTEFFGHISNLRILKGTALYTSNFTPPTRELTAIPNTVLLACQSTTNAAEEKTGKTITVNGNAVANELTPGLLTNIVKSGGSSAITGSVEFDGNDYLSIPSSTDFDFGSTTDFTIECWIYQQNRNSTYYTILFQTDGSNLGGFGLVISPGSGGILQIFRGGFVVSSTSSVSTNGWVHIAASRKSGTTRLFINGILDGTSNTLYTPTFNDVRIGMNPSASYENFQGFISNLRIIKGTALYTSNFIPPTRKLTRVPGTVLLCCQDSNNPTQEATGKTLTPYGSLIYNPPELVTDGGFSSASNWPSRGADWTISGGVATINSANSGYDFLGILTSSTRNGELYELKFDISNWTAGRLELSQSDSSNIGVTVSGNGSYTFRFRYTGTTNGNIGLYSYTDTTSSFALDNLSLKQVASVPSPPFTPSIGSDGSVEFVGPIKINTPNYFYLPTGPTEQREPINNNYGARGILGGGYNGSVWINSLQYVTIATTGNALDFGDLSSGRPYVDAVSSSTRGVFGGGYGNNTMDYITISSTGNAADFGDSTSARRDYAGCSNSTRGLFGGGQGTNIIDYITIASIGNAVDFGDLSSVRYFLGACASPVRGLFAGGDSGAPFALRGIDYVTIASAGNSQTFGGLTNSRSTIRGCSNSIRGVFSGGYTLPGSSNTIDYVNISSTGTATDFGDMTTARGITSAFSSSLRGLFTNWTPSTGVSAIDYINITSTSNALDFGDTITQAQGGCSNGHGGLG
jgi:hypothetical protein